MTKDMLAGELHGATFRDFFPTSEVWADEEQATLDKLKAALLSDLDPHTPYQHVVAENLVELEWEKMRYRRIRDSLLNTALKETTTQALSGQVDFFASVRGEDRETARDLTSRDLVKQKSARETLANKDISISELVTAAYQTCLRDLAFFDAQIAEVETRRRKLRMDYDLLKSKHAVLIDDADIVDMT